MRSIEFVWLLSGTVVVVFCLFLISLALVIAIRPSLGERFLRSFASSAPAHYTEQALRLLLGAGIVNFSSSMWHPELFKLFGWLIVVTTIGLLLTPWQWHRTFAAWVMPHVIRRMRLFALGACALGAFVLYGVSRAASS
jgi:uncharacterized protein YjeT (DUF2065 family)